MRNPYFDIYGSPWTQTCRIWSENRWNSPRPYACHICTCNANRFSRTRIIATHTIASCDVNPLYNREETSPWVFRPLETRVVASTVSRICPPTAWCHVAAALVAVRARVSRHPSILPYERWEATPLHSVRSNSVHTTSPTTSSRDYRNLVDTRNDWPSAIIASRPKKLRISQASSLLAYSSYMHRVYRWHLLLLLAS